MNYVNEILTVSSYITFFKECPDTTAARKKYLQYAKHVHPDMNSNSAQYTEAFQKLHEFWDSYQNKTNKYTPSAKPVIKTKKHSYDIGLVKDALATEVTSVIASSYDDGHKQALLHISSSIGDNDLIKNASSHIKKLNSSVPDNYQAFFPQLVEKFSVHQKDGNHSAYAVETYPQDFYTLDEVMSKYPQGLHGRDIIWIFKRLLVAIGNAHDIGLTHTAVIPSSILVNPVQHGVILKSWEYSVESKQSLVAVPVKYKAWYSSHLLEKKTVADYRLDVSLAAQSMLHIASDSVPKGIKLFLKGCVGTSTPVPSELITELDEVALRVYGAPKFHTFTM